ncbi:hypothetical protein [Sphingomonas abietis]|uniref:Uncharacterized protein n=1 Tax=Sphingomonas abietis TaxID=3012344 RepID=A0ABY7NJW9_9SPHN|nr:hypothetical protein [Sphingomonas abietis]WBO21542.1 hypothetical protein PBT88_15340 [Sphingomonas abietis]
MPDVKTGSSRARFEIRAGRSVGLSAEVEVTPLGVAAIGTLVAGILLATGAMVRLIQSVPQELRHRRDA